MQFLTSPLTGSGKPKNSVVSNSVQKLLNGFKQRRNGGDMQEIKKIEIESLAVTGGSFGTVYAFIYGIFMLIEEIEGAAGEFSVVGVILRYVFISIFGGFILGFLCGLIAAIIYNISAKVFGGIKIQVE